jgi:hypothetical protein
VWTADVIKDEKRRALRGTMGSRTGRKGETALSGSTAETPQARRFPYRKFDDQEIKKQVVL